MHWFDLDDGDLEVGVLELDVGLELLAVEDGSGFMWVWRAQDGRVLAFPARADC